MKTINLKCNECRTLFCDVEAYQGEVYKFDKGHIRKRSNFPDKLKCPQCKSVSTFLICKPSTVL
jgi:hypothetical protein